MGGYIVEASIPEIEVPVWKPKPHSLLGPLVREWCEKNKVKQAHLAKRLGVDGSYISRIISGDRSPQRDVATKLAAIMGIPIEHMALLLFDVDPEEFISAIESHARDRVYLALIDEALTW